MSPLLSSSSGSGVFNLPPLHHSYPNIDTVSLEHVVSPLTSLTNSEEPNPHLPPSSTPLTTSSTLIPGNCFPDSQFLSIAGPHSFAVPLSPTPTAPRSSPYSSRYSDISSSSNDSPTSTSPLSPSFGLFGSLVYPSPAQTSDLCLKRIKRKIADESEGGGIDNRTDLENSDTLNEREDPKKLKSEIELLKKEKIALKLKNDQLNETIKKQAEDREKQVAKDKATIVKLKFKNLVSAALLHAAKGNPTFQKNIQGMITSLNALERGLKQEDKSAEGI